LHGGKFSISSGSLFIAGKPRGNRIASLLVNFKRRAAAAGRHSTDEFLAIRNFYRAATDFRRFKIAGEVAANGRKFGGGEFNPARA